MMTATLVKTPTYQNGHSNGHAPVAFTGRITDGVITPEAVAFYHDQGYLIVENALTPAELAEMRNETTRICRGELGEVRGVTPADANEADDDVLRQYLCIHFPHKISETMLRYLGHPVMRDVLVSVIGPPLFATPPPSPVVVFPVTVQSVRVTTPPVVSLSSAPPCRLLPSAPLVLPESVLAVIVSVPRLNTAAPSRFATLPVSTAF